MTPENSIRQGWDKARRHVGWLRTEGIAKIVEEDNLRPINRTREALTKWRWRRAHGVEPGTARPVYLVGVQRSGTNMLTRGLERAPSFEVHNENDRRAFRNFRLDVAAAERLVASSRHAFVLFKPLCDSHLTTQLLDHSATAGQSGAALWVYRDPDARARSALAKFGDANLQALRSIADGSGLDSWQALGLTATQLDYVRSLDWSVTTPYEAALIFWALRNEIYFSLGLDRRPDTILTRYEDLLADPVAAFAPICNLLELEFDPQYVEHIEVRHAPADPAPVAPHVRDLVDAMLDRLQSASTDLRP